MSFFEDRDYEAKTRDNAEAWQVVDEDGDTIAIFPTRTYEEDGEGRELPGKRNAKLFARLGRLTLLFADVRELKALVQSPGAPGDVGSLSREQLIEAIKSISFPRFGLGVWED